MNKPRILVISATGNTGQPTAEALLHRKQAVRILSRRPSEIANRLVAQGAELSIGDFTVARDLQRALKDIQRVFYCHPIMPGMVKNLQLFIELAAAAGVETVVNIGQYLARHESHPSASTQSHRRAHEILDQSGLGAIHVDPGWFAVNQLAPAIFITQLGLFPFPLGKGRTAAVSHSDIGAVAASLLIDPAGHVGMRYQPTGPESLGGMEMARQLSEVVGRSVHYLDGAEFVFWKACKFFGLSDYMISQLQLYLADFQKGNFDYPPNDVVLRFKGSPPESFAQCAEKHFRMSGLLPQTRRKKLQAMQELIKIGFTSSPARGKLRELNRIEMATTRV